MNNYGSLLLAASDEIAVKIAKKITCFHIINIDVKKTCKSISVVL